MIVLPYLDYCSNECSVQLRKKVESGVSLPKLEHALRGVKKHEAESGEKKRVRFPIMPRMSYQYEMV